MNVACLITFAAAISVCGCALTGGPSGEREETEKASGVPKIVFTKQMHDFGTVQYSASGLTHSFVFTNTGSAALLIKNVKAG